MLYFKDFQQAVHTHFEVMKQKQLYVTDANTDELWDIYFSNIPAEFNYIYRKRPCYDCTCCKHFIRLAGNIVTISSGRIETIWDIDTDNAIWASVAKKMADYVRSHTVTDVYYTKYPNVGTPYNMDQDENGEPIRWQHFYLVMPDHAVAARQDSVPAVQAECRTDKELFLRALNELSLETTSTVLELIDQNSLYKGTEFRYMVDELHKHQEAVKDMDPGQRELYAWEYSVQTKGPVCRIANSSIGTLLYDIQKGLNLEEAVRKYESVVAPVNYKRSKPIFTKQMLEEAKETLVQLGYLDSLTRRYANADDISVNNILFTNRDAAKRIHGAMDIFAALEKNIPSVAKKFDRVEEIGIEDFIQNVLPHATSVEAYVENRHAPNFVSLIAPANKDSKSMFKWDNNFSWAYSGNVTDSIVRQNVKKAGGKVDGDLRFSIQWNDLADGWNQNDEDAHCILPDGNHIYFGHKRDSVTHGVLDVDITHPKRDQAAVENITWPDRRLMKPGVYRFFVETFAGRGGRGGFRAEVEFDGNIYAFDYQADTKHKGVVQVAEVSLSPNGTFSIKEKMPFSERSREIWNIKTNEFVPVNVICYSPNYWDEQKGVGNKHYFFMLKDCINSELPNAWYNEFLNNDLYPKHKRVLEAMSSYQHVLECDDQLSGLGFSSTLRNTLVVRVTGTTERTLKIRF